MIARLAWLAGLCLLGCEGAPATDPARGAPDAGGDAEVGDAEASLDAAHTTPAAGWPACGRPGPMDNLLRFNHLRMLGTHNSYHLEPERRVHPSHAYTHPPLDVQLGLGVRQFELDVHHRLGAGLEVFHIPRLDEETSCRRFTECLALLAAWSQAHPCHAPLLVWIEPKALDNLDRSLGPVIAQHAALEADVLAVWPRERLLTPDDLRGSHPDLPTALAAEGWPTLGALRGRLVLALLDRGAQRTAYLADRPNLAGRLLFVAADGPEDPFAAFFKINNAARDAERIAALTAAGFHVTSNVDGAEAAAEPPDGAPAAEHLAASLAADAHAYSSDFVIPHPTTGYQAALPGGSPGCHPRLAPPGCTAQAVEALEAR